jgi:hypothetical protein
VPNLQQPSRQADPGQGIAEFVRQHRDGHALAFTGLGGGQVALATGLHLHLDVGKVTENLDVDA